MTIEGVKHIILILSGKGGVGKSTVSVQLSLLLKERGLKVGLLDIDLCGPSIPYLLGLEDKDVHQSSEGWIPVYADEEQNLAVMSLGFIIKNREQSVVWRGPKKTVTINQFLSDVNWRDLDYLIIDTPPGTSDEHISVIQKIRELKGQTKSVGAILVTTPQQVAIEDVRKEYHMCEKFELPVIGIVENMSGYVCANCQECTNIFSSDGGKLFAELVKIPFLGKIPIDLRVGDGIGKLQSISSIFPDSPSSATFQNIVDAVIKS